MPSPLPNASFKPLVLSIALALGLPVALMQRAQAETVEQTHHLSISAQPLAQALAHLAEQTNSRIHAAERLPERASLAVEGQMSTSQALNTLLSASDMEWHRQADGSIVLIKKSPAVTEAMALPLTMVNAQQPAQGTTRYDRQQIEKMPVRQGKITELLRQNPAVSFDKGSLSSKTPADLSAENVSINGAKYWDNNFSVDGISMNNDLNPGGRSVAANSSMTDLPANTSQGLNLDVSLLESIEVYDSNVPAEYGGFTGGVVDAKTRLPSQKLSGSASVSLTKDSWTEYHIDDQHQDDFFHSAEADGTSEIQPKFRTLTYRATLEGHLTENIGLIGSIVRKQSDVFDKNIYVGYMTDNGVSAPTKQDLGQTVDNFFVKGVWHANDRLSVTGSVNYAPQEAEHFNINTLNGGFAMASGGLQTTLKADWQGDWGAWEHSFNYSNLEQSRQNGANYFKAWYHSADKDWSDPTQTWNAAMEGTYGNIEQMQQRAGYDLKLSLLPFALGATVHHVKVGAHYLQTAASYSRDDEFIQANGTDLIATFSCLTASGAQDTEYCSDSPVLAKPYRPWTPNAGQMYKRLYHYVTGEVEEQQKDWSAFVDDTINWGDVTVRAGLRAEQNDFSNNLNLAPRLSLTWDVLGNGATKLIGGANRYYGRDIFDYRLREGRDAMRYVSLRDNTTLAFGPQTLAGKNTTDLADLKTPYDDELSLGVEQIAYNTLFSLRYVLRDGQDQIHREPVKNDGTQAELASTYYQYNNDGHTDSEHLYLTITPLQALTLWGSTTHGSLAFGVSDIESSSKSYDDEYDDTLVMYKGDVINSFDIPVDNYSRPWTAKLVTQTNIPTLNLTLGNFFNYRAAYSQVIRDGRVPYQGQNIYNYVEKDLPAALTWDTRIGWELPTGTTEAAFVNVDIGNVLNRRNTIGSSSSTNLNAEIDYELGRNYTLEVGYRF